MPGLKARAGLRPWRLMLNTTDCILTAQHSQACIKPKGQTIVLIAAVSGIRAEAAGISDRSTHHVDWRARLPLANILYHTIEQPLTGFAGAPGIVGGNQQVGIPSASNGCAIEGGSLLSTSNPAPPISPLRNASDNVESSEPILIH